MRPFRASLLTFVLALAAPAAAYAAKPVNTARPVVSGTAQQGQTLTTTTGTWTNSPTGYAYQWQRCTFSSATGDYTHCANMTVAAALTNAYTLRSVDVGAKMRVRVTASNASGKAIAYSAKTAVVTTPSTSPWPASYFTGPLGANEVLPKSNGGVLLGMWSGVAGQGNGPAQHRQFMENRIADMGRVPDIIATQCVDQANLGGCGYDVSSTDLSENWIHSKGAIPFITWDPSSALDYTNITAGNYDTNIDAFAARLKAFGHRTMVRLFSEFNDPGRMAWTGPDLIAAWHHVVDRVRADGATNVGWVWNSEERACCGADSATVDSAYPGDSYVDWVSTDQYNWDANFNSTPAAPGWAEFSDLFNYTYQGRTSMEQRYGPRKPFYVAETNSMFDTPNIPAGHVVDPNRKANWYRNIPAAAAQMPYLIGFTLFDIDTTASEPGHQLRVDSPCDSAGNNCLPSQVDPNTYQGFLDMTRAASLNVGAAGGTN